MFYHWLAPLGKQYIIFNLFNYISFRAAGATVTALLLAFVLGPSVIRRLRARKVLGTPDQPVRCRSDAVYVMDGMHRIPG
jgi:phospho-N-acetylmuramoyl-pentapeptide-transferase